MAAGGIYMWATGKGQMAISGYNTMTPEQREHYDAERMAKDIGKFLVVIALVMLVGFGSMYYLSNGTMVFIVSIGLLFVLIIAFLLYAKGGKYLKDPARPVPPPTERQRRNTRAALGTTFFVTALILAVAFLMIGSGSVHATMEDDTLRVNGPMMNRSIDFDDIKEIEFRYDFDHGSRIGGFGGSNVLAGNFNNREFGDYSLACYLNVDLHIVVIPNQGRVLVFNLSTIEETEQFGEALLKSVFDFRH
jgi:hypothetical protein